MDEKSHLATLLTTLPQVGKIEWIGIRSARRMPMQAANSVQVNVADGIIGDHYTNQTTRKRQVTLIQAEHLAVVAACLAKAIISATMLRRNLLVSGVNLLALKDRQFYVGEVLLETTGTCEPCSYMEEVLGDGGYNAMRGHGGITARVIQGGHIHLGDAVYLSGHDN